MGPKHEPGKSKASLAGVQLGTETKPAGWGQRPNWAKLWYGLNQWHRPWTLALLLSLMKTRLDFFHSGMDGDKT